MNLVSEQDPSLSLTAEWVDFNNPGFEIEQTARDMLALMYVSGGVGLAALQIGLNKRMFVMGDTKHHLVCINPCIVSVSGVTELSKEGCLSFPRLFLQVRRPTKVGVVSYNIKGQKVSDELDGIWGRIFQHELDHLDGICFTQRVSKLKLQMAQKKR